MTTPRIARRTLRPAFPACALLLLLAVGAAEAQAPAPGGVRKQIGTPTRQVVLFTDLEQQVLAAVTQKDRAKLGGLLADTFQLWMADHPAQPVDRDRWIEQALSSGGATGIVREMNVNMEGQTAIVSFVLTRPPGSAATDQFVVDVWSKRTDAWRLSARYASATLHQGSPRPTGKE